MKTNKQGFTLIESVAAIVILTVVLSSAFAIIFFVQQQSRLSNLQHAAGQVAQYIHDDIIADHDHQTLLTWLGGDARVMDENNCDNSGIDCNLFNLVFNQITYDDVQISFEAPDLTYGFIRFSIIMPYSDNRELVLRGVLYETD